LLSPLEFDIRTDVASESIQSLRIGRYSGALRLVAAAIALAAASCTPYNQYSHKPAEGPERAMRPVKATVVSMDEADRSGLQKRLFAIPFGTGADGTRLVEDFLARADAAKVRLIAGLTITVRSAKGGRALDCATAIVPESIATTHMRPGRTEMVSVPRLVTRSVMEPEFRCRTVTRSRLVTRTEYQQRCRYVSKPVTRSRTTYSSQYDSFSKGYRSVPRTETYTTYEGSNECRSEPVTRTTTEWQPEQECRSEMVSKTVTRFEYQLESQYRPPRLETIVRQRLRELSPVCRDAGPAGQPPGAGKPNRIEGAIYLER
jgi:hypothetical protein